MDASRRAPRPALGFYSTLRAQGDAFGPGAVPVVAARGELGPARTRTSSAARSASCIILAPLLPLPRSCR